MKNAQLGTGPIAGAALTEGQQGTMSVCASYRWLEW